MFTVEIGSVITTLLWVQSLSAATARHQPGFIGAIAAWLWFTVLFANFAEALAEGQGKSAGRGPAEDAAGHRGKETLPRVRGREGKGTRSGGLRPGLFLNAEQV